MNLSSIAEQQCSETSLSVACMCVHLWHWVNGACFGFHSSGEGPTVHWRWNWCKHKPQCMHVCVCVPACARPHGSVYAVQCPPLNSEGGFTHTHTQTSMHAHTLALALCSPWVVCAANVYDLNEANPTGLFQWIENDLQDAATGPSREEIRQNLRAPFQVILWLDLHTCLYVCSHSYHHLFLSRSCTMTRLCLFHLPTTHPLDGCLYLTN